MTAGEAQDVGLHFREVPAEGFGVVCPRCVRAAPLEEWAVGSYWCDACEDDHTTAVCPLCGVPTDPIYKHKPLGVRAMARENIYREIDAERDYQDRKWGGAAHDDGEETPESFERYVKEFAGVEGRAAGKSHRERMVKVAALAVAAIERQDRLDARK